MSFVIVATPEPDPEHGDWCNCEACAYAAFREVERFEASLEGTHFSSSDTSESFHQADPRFGLNDWRRMEGLA